MQFCFIDDNVSDPTLTEEHIQESHIEDIVDDQDNLHYKTQDIDSTYVTTDSLFLEQRLLQKQAVYRTVSCPDLEKGVRYISEGLKVTGSNDTSQKQVNRTEIEKGPRASTPIDTETEAGKLPKKVTLQDLLYHPGDSHIPVTDIIATPGL